MWACFERPSSCGENIMFSLVLDRRRRWNVKLVWLSRPSIKPQFGRAMNVAVIFASSVGISTGAGRQAQDD